MGPLSRYIFQVVENKGPGNVSTKNMLKIIIIRRILIIKLIICVQHSFQLNLCIVLVNTANADLFGSPF